MITIENTIEFLEKQDGKEYNMEWIKILRLFPWTQNDRTLKSLVLKDKTGDNELKARIVGIGPQTRYHIKSKNIIKYLERYGSLLMANRSQK